jgi:hypothetical protein
MYAMLSEMSKMVWWHTTETVEIPLGNFVGLEEQRRPGEQREAEGLGEVGFPALEARGLGIKGMCIEDAGGPQGA